MLEQEFIIYRTELEVYLEIEGKFAKIMEGGRYITWQAEEEIPARVEELNNEDKIKGRATLADKNAKIAQMLKTTQRYLKLS